MLKFVSVILQKIIGHLQEISPHTLYVHAHVYLQIIWPLFRNGFWYLVRIHSLSQFTCKG